MKKLLRDKRNNAKGKLEILLGLESKKYGKIIGRIKKKTERLKKDIKEKYAEKVSNHEKRKKARDAVSEMEEIPEECRKLRELRVIKGEQNST